MKIQYCAASRIPSRSANSIHVMKMCQAFHINGHDVHLVLPDIKKERTPGINDVYDYYGVKPCFSINYLPWIPVKGKAYLFGLLAGKYGKKHNFDLVYSRDIIAAYFAAQQGLPIIFESHAPIVDSGRVIIPRLFSNLLKQKNFKYLVVITQSLKSWYLSNYDIPPDRILVAPDGADLPNVSELDNIDLHLSQVSDKFRIGYCGHLYPGKGMEIISQLVQLCPDIEFNIVGGLENDIKYWQNQLEGYQNIIFHGYRPHSDVLQMMRQMNVLIAPNLQSVKLSKKIDIGKWTSPLKIFEYMSACKPIIASDIPVLTEVLEHERNALLCDPDNPEKWQSTLYRLRDDSTLSRQLAHNAYEDLRDKYNWQARAELILSSATNVKTL
ncbi:MAG: glycosyltransferase family 4 protein [Sphaerospermopsis kisseleviana]